jgi:NAD(P)H dehydrogenase (quinone)
MDIYVIYCHPSNQSFTHAVMEMFTRGLDDIGHTYTLGDLYAMEFKTVLSLEEYRREIGRDPHLAVPDDVRIEQAKIESAGGLVFIYPLWWGDCPAQLKGWFDRVFTYGFAYTFEDTMFLPKLTTKKALSICTAGDTVNTLERSGVAQSMRHVMVNNRLRGAGVKDVEFVFLGGTATGGDEVRNRNLDTAYQLGKEF